MVCRQGTSAEDRIYSELGRTNNKRHLNSYVAVIRVLRGTSAGDQWIADAKA